jgi:hypothetical protein
MVRELLADDSSAIVSQNPDGQEPAPPGFHERGEDIGRAGTGRDPDGHIRRPGMGDQLAGEDGLASDVVGDGRGVRGLGGH